MEKPASPKPAEQLPLVMNGKPADWVKPESEATSDTNQDVDDATPENSGTDKQEESVLKSTIPETDIVASEEKSTLQASDETKTISENGMDRANAAPSDGSGDPSSIDHSVKTSTLEETVKNTEIQEDMKSNSNEPTDDMISKVEIMPNASSKNGVTEKETDNGTQDMIGEARDVKDLPTEMTASMIGSLDANDNKNEKPTQLDTSLPEGVEPPMSLPPPPPRTTGRMSIGGRPLSKNITAGDTSSRSNSSRMSLPPRTNGAPLLDPRRAPPSFCVDLAYIPCHGDPHHVDSAFFSKIKAKHYVLSSQSPSRYILDAFLDGLTEGEDEIQLIPTYESPVLRSWVTQREEDLQMKHVKVAPSASRCSIQLQDNEIGCPAFRLEF